MDYILYFTIYAFFGYLAEVIICSISHHKLVGRGFLFGPVLPIYGFGLVGTLVILFIQPAIASFVTSVPENFRLILNIKQFLSRFNRS